MPHMQDARDVPVMTAVTPGVLVAQPDRHDLHGGQTATGPGLASAYAPARWADVDAFAFRQSVAQRRLGVLGESVEAADDVRIGS